MKLRFRTNFDKFALIEASGSFELSRDWEFFFESTGSRSSSETPFYEVKAGANYEISPILGVGGGGIVLEEPGDIPAVGAEASVRWVLSALWRGSKPTKLSFRAMHLIYYLSVTDAAINGTLSPTQSLAEISLTQEIGILDLNARFTKYYYSFEPTALGPLINSRIGAFGAGLHLAEGLPGWVTTLTATARLTPKWRVEAAYSQADSAVFKDRTEALVLSLSYRPLKQWSFSTDVLQRLGRSNQNSGTIGVGLEYFW